MRLRGRASRVLGSVSTTTLALTLTGSFVTFLSKTVTVGDRPLKITAIVPSSGIAAATTGRVQLALIDDTGAQLTFVETQPIAGSAQGGSIILRWFGVATPGQRTFSVQARELGATGGNVASGATFPAQLLIEEG